MRVHYRVTDGRRILAYGCGASGLPGADRTSDWRFVTCANCKRSKEWRASAAQVQGKEGPKCRHRQPVGACSSCIASGDDERAAEIFADRRKGSP